MKATLEFELPQENYEFYNSVNGGRYRDVVWDFDQWLRGQLKYGTLSEKEAEVIEGIRDKFNELITDHSLSLYEGLE